MNWIAILATLGTSMVKQRVDRAKQQAMWMAFAAFAGLGALIAFLCALQVWIAQSIGPLYADLVLGVGLLLVALCCLLAAKLAGAVGRANQTKLPELGRAATSALPTVLKSRSSRWPLLIGGAALTGLLFGRFTSGD